MFFGNNCSWILIVLLVLVCCCGHDNGLGNGFGGVAPFANGRAGCGCGCGCN